MGTLTTTPQRCRLTHSLVTCIHSLHHTPGQQLRLSTHSTQTSCLPVSSTSVCVCVQQTHLDWRRQVSSPSTPVPLRAHRHAHIQRVQGGYLLDAGQTCSSTMLVCGGLRSADSAPTRSWEAELTKCSCSSSSLRRGYNPFAASGDSDTNKPTTSRPPGSTLVT